MRRPHWDISKDGPDAGVSLDGADGRGDP